jgi:hypothetical protein
MSPLRLRLVLGEDRGLVKPRADVDRVRLQPRKEQLERLHLIVRVMAAIVDDEPESVVAQQWLQRPRIGRVPLRDRAPRDRWVETKATRIEPHQPGLGEPLPPRAQRGAAPDPDLQQIEALVAQWRQEALPGP